MKARLRLPHRPDNRPGRLASSASARSTAAESDVHAEDVSPPAERVRALARDAKAGGVAFQSVAVAALKTLHRVLHYERQAAAAALSLAQQENLEAMSEELERVTQALREALSAQGAKMLGFPTAPEADEPEEHFWWFALTEAIQVLDESIARTTSLVHGQPKGSPARTLASVVVRLLRAHHNALLIEAEDWMS